MKVFILVILALISLNTLAAEGKLGLGVMLGNPTGLSGKYWLDDNKAVDGGVAYSVGKHSEFSLHSDYLLHKEDALYVNDVHPLDLYYGLGGRMEFGDDIEIGVRIPVGVAHKISGPEAEVFGEVAPIVDILTKTGLELHLAVGARYYF